MKSIKSPKDSVNTENRKKNEKKLVLPVKKCDSVTYAD